MGSIIYTSQGHPHATMHLGSFTHLVKGGAHASGEVSIVPKHGDHGNLLVAVEAAGRRIGERGDAVV